MDESRNVRNAVRKCLGITIVALTLVLSVSHAAWAQEEWKPKRAIRLIIKYAAGGGTDVLLRQLAAGMEESLGQPITVMNQTGAVGAIAVSYVFSQPADGYTWLGYGNINKHLRPMNLNATIPWKDWQVFNVGSSLGSVSVTPDSPIKTFEDFVKLAKEKPGIVRVGTDGKGGLWHEQVAFIENEMGFKINPITYEGGAPAALACIQKEVEVVWGGLHEQIEFIKAGKLRNLAVWSESDIEVPQVGVLRSLAKIVPATKPLAPYGSMYGIAVKRETPKNIQMAIKKALLIGLQKPAFEEMLAKRYLRKNVLFGSAADKKAAQLECLNANLLYKLGVTTVTPASLGLPAPENFEKWWPPKDYKPSVVE
jgi:tripartite-type tricarboxylate transporter receptor subunit TctC